MMRADWKITDAFLWFCDRNEDRLNDPSFKFPSLGAIILYPTNASEDDARLVQAAKEVVGHLRSGALAARRIAANGEETPIAAGYWNGKISLDDPDYCEPEIVIAADCCVTLMPPLPPQKVVPMSNDEVETWCRDWMAAGHGNGGDKAWDAFKILPRAKGLTRDDVFRPMFKLAKKTRKQ